MLEFDGTRQGTSERWSKTYVMQYSKAPSFRQVTVAKQGDLEDLAPIWMAERDGVIYDRSDEQECAAAEMQAGDALGESYEPARIAAGVIGADDTGSEKVNDVQANHYTFDERALGLKDAVKAEGELWVAANGGYLVKYLLTLEGKADYFGEGLEGTLTLDFALTDVNSPVTLQLPADCPAGMVNAPRLPDAADVLNFPGVLSYDTTANLAETAAFYQNELPLLGWQVLDEPELTEALVLLSFQKGDEILMVSVLPVTGGTKVSLLLERAEE